jgi:hypothetical protein
MVGLLGKFLLSHAGYSPQRRAKGLQLRRKLVGRSSSSNSRRKQLKNYTWAVIVSAIPGYNSHGLNRRHICVFACGLVFSLQMRMVNAFNRIGSLLDHSAALPLEQWQRPSFFQKTKSPLAVT